MRHSAESIQGRVYGIFFLTVFGMLWFLIGAWYGKPLRAVPSVVLAVVSATLFAAGFVLLQHAKRLPNAPLDKAKPIKIMRMFAVVNMVQWLAIFAANYMFNRLHQPAYIVPSVTIIIGLHFYPLVRLFEAPSHYITGTSLIGWSISCMVMLPIQSMPAMVCLGNGAILLTASAANLLTGYKATHLPESLPAMAGS